MRARLEWLAYFLNVAGAVLNAYKLIYCWPVWLVSALMWTWFARVDEKPAQVAMWLTFVATNLFGWYQWGMV